MIKFLSHTEYAVPMLLTVLAPVQFNEHSEQNRIVGAINEVGFIGNSTCIIRFNQKPL